nr:MAG TPA: hypothetical protein [Caudoviricetes sp.]
MCKNYLRPLREGRWERALAAAVFAALLLRPLRKVFEAALAARAEVTLLALDFGMKSPSFCTR